MSACAGKWRKIAMICGHAYSTVAISFAVLLLLFCPPYPPSAHASQAVQTVQAKKNVKLGVLAMRGQQETLKQWGPLADYLSGRIAGYSFDIVPMDTGTVDFFLQGDAVDFLLTNPGNFVLNKETHNLKPLLTVESMYRNVRSDKFGAIIFTRADRTDINKISDLKGKSFMAVDPLAFGGWWMAWREMKDRGMNPYKDLSMLSFSGFPSDAIVYSVLEGKVNAGTVRSGLLERLAEEGKISLSDFRVIEPQNYTSFPYATTTRLYPEWTFASLSHVDTDLTNQVVAALMALKPEDKAAKSAHIAGFSTNVDLTEVYKCLDELHIWLFDYTTPSKFLIQRYKKQIIAVLCGFVIMTALALYAFSLNLKLKKSVASLAMAEDDLQKKNAALSELSRTLEEKIRSEVESNRHKDLLLINQSHLANLGRLAAGITHEINTPLTYAKGNLELLERHIVRSMGEEQMAGASKFISPIKDGINRIATIVDSMKEISGVMRSYKESAEVNLFTTLIYAIRMVHTQAKHVAPLYINGVPFTIDIDRNAEHYPIKMRSHNVEQVWLVMLNNAMEAFADTKIPFEERKIEISIGSQSGKIAVSFRDNAGGIPEDNLEKIFEMFVTTKPTGSGIGLHVAKAIVTEMGGTISARNEGNWAVFDIVF